MSKTSALAISTDKDRNFVTEPMGDKLVTELSGVGAILGERLESQGFDKAYVVFGQFLLLKKTKDLFLDWMKDSCGCNKRQSTDCFECLDDWCIEFL